jgi:hypothetical protein
LGYITHSLSAFFAFPSSLSFILLLAFVYTQSLRLLDPVVSVEMSHNDDDGLVKYFPKDFLIIIHPPLEIV